ncbi:MAG: hypothetical protein KDA87_12840 [Planctomycetales bacterium]|nr:hypothetical protein [Planctomycetales bacterium]
MVRTDRRNFLQAVSASLAMGHSGLIAQVDQRANETFPSAVSKKGLQVQMIDDAIQLGVKHATLNVDLARFIKPDATADSSHYRWQDDQGRTYHFDQPAVDQLQHRIRQLSDQGILVYLILLVYRHPDATVNRIMLHPQFDPAAPNGLSAFNVKTDEGKRWLTALIDFMAARWGKIDSTQGRTVGWIVGNEVNSHWFWSNRGRCSLEEFLPDYADAFRLIHAAVKRHSSWARIYVSLEHHWNIRYPGGDDRQAFAGRPFLDAFAQRMQEQGDIDWHVAFHPYPENLFEPRFWRDKSATAADDSPRITFKNLEVLIRYLDRPERRYAGERRRVILSEQGFHTPDGDDGPQVQAAAYCYAYRLVERQEGIDAFILHRHVDHAQEGGLRLGLWTRKSDSIATPDQRKPIYHCFHAADTANWPAAFEFAKPMVGLGEWPE